MKVKNDVPDRRTGDPLHRVVHDLEAEPELPPSGELEERWQKHGSNDPRSEAAIHRAFPKGDEDVQWYDDEWREFLKELHKDFHA